MRPLGVYIHYPWCRHRCPYCDFPIAIADREPIPHARYADAVIAELGRQAARFAGRDLVSIYFGGGTPSLWPPVELQRVMTAVTGTFPGSPREVTLEVNPIDCRPDAMQAWRQLGITRLSIGVQSTSDTELVALGRDHRMGDGRAAVIAALAAGFASLSADVIAGAPRGGEAEPSAPRQGAKRRAAPSRGGRGRHAPGVSDGGTSSAHELAALGVPHLSVYELTLEPRAPLSRAVARGEVTMRGEDALADLYLAIHDLLEAAGYEHYEISSYARPGHRAVHNSLYWQGADYLGLGNGAASFCRSVETGGGERWTNPRAVARYLAGEPAEVDRLDADDLAADRIWLGLRTLDGVEIAAFRGRERTLEELCRDRLVTADGARVRPTLLGFLHGNRVARRVVGS